MLQALPRQKVLGRVVIHSIALKANWDQIKRNRAYSPRLIEKENKIWIFMNVRNESKCN
jgi:hypothetical protein